MKRMSNGADQAKCGRITGRALAALLTLCVLFACMAGTAMAETVASGDCGATGSSVQWTLDDTGTLTISGSGRMEVYSVDSMGNDDRPWSAFVNSIQSVVIESGVTEISTNAFMNATNLKSVAISDTVGIIGSFSFSGCSGLTSVTIPASVIFIQDNAFDGCSSLTTVNVPCNWNGSLYNFGESVKKTVHSKEPSYMPNGDQHVAAYSCCGATVTEDHIRAEDTPRTDNKDGTHSFTCVCDGVVIEPHSFNSVTGKCAQCGTDTAAASVTAGGETTYYATLDEALTAAENKIATVRLLKDAETTVKHTIPSGGTFDGGEFTVSGKTLTNEGTIAGGTFTANVENWGGNVTGGSFAMLKCYDGSVSGEISFETLVNSGDGTKYDLSLAVNIGGATVKNNRPDELPVSKLNLPDGYVLEVGGQIVSALSFGENGTIVAHPEHTYVDGVCGCGEACDHAIDNDGKCACGKFVAVASVTIGNITTYYETLQEALTAANGQAAAVTLLKDVEISTVCTIPADVTFDGGSFTVSSSSVTGDVHNNGVIENGIFEVYVKNNGTVKGGDFADGSYAFHNYGVVTGGRFVLIGCYDNSSICGAVKMADWGTLVYNGVCTIDLSDAVLENNAYLCNETDRDLLISTITLPEGYAVEYNGAVVSVLPAGALGKIVSHTHAYTTKDFDTTHHWEACVCGAKQNVMEHTLIATPNAGEENHSYACACGYQVASPENHTFDLNAADKVVCDCSAKAVASVTIENLTAYYANFANAVDTWKSHGDTLTLLDDVTYGEVIQLKSGEAKTLDLNGQTLTSTAMANYALSHNNVPLTIKDSGTDGAIHSGGFYSTSVVYSYNGKLTLESGTFAASGNYPLTITNTAAINSSYVTLQGNVYQIMVNYVHGSEPLTITGDGCDGWKIWNNTRQAVPISIPDGFHLEDNDGNVLEKNTELPAQAYTIIRVNHEHSWSYAADGTTITATCANTDGRCPDAEQSLTLNAADAVYSGNPVEAEVTCEGTDLTYALRYTGTVYDSADAPTDAGDYTVTMTVGDKSVSDTFTISPKNIENCSVTLDETTYEYSGGVPAFVIHAVDSGVGSYAMQLDTDYTVSASGIDVGEYKLTVTGTGNYTGSVELDYSITPKPITISSVVIEDVVYNPDGYTLTVKEVVFDGVVEGETLVIGEDGDYTAAAQMTGENAASDAAKASVTVALTNDNYSLSEAKAEATFRITQSGAELTAVTDENSYTYGDAIIVSGSVTATGKEPEAETFSLKRAFAAPAAMQAALYDAAGNQIAEPVSVADGKYELKYDTKSKLVEPGEDLVLTVQFTGNASVADQKMQTNRFALKAKELTAALSGSTAKTYDAGTAVTDVSGLMLTLDTFEGDSVTAEASSFAFEDANAGTGKPVIAQGIALSGEDAKFYQLAVDTAQAAVGTITPAAAPEIIFPTAGGITYGQALESSVLTGGSTAHGSFAWQDAATIPPAGSGSYTVVFTPGNTLNYDYTAVEGWNAETGTVERTVVIAVAKAAGEARVTIESWVYGAAPNAPVPESATHGTENVTYLYKAKDAPESAYSAEIPTQIGEYTVRATFAETDNYLPISAEADFAVTMSQTAFEGGLSVYNGEEETTFFTYGDTITVKAKPAATGESAFRRFLRSSVPADHMALFFGDVQLSEAVAANADGVYEMTYDTADKMLSVGENSITAQYVSDGNKADYSQSVNVNIKKKELTVVGVSAKDRIFKAGNTKVTVTGVTIYGIVGIDEVYTEVKTGDAGSDQIGTYENVTLPQELELKGADAQWYTISGGVSVPANGDAGVQILAVPDDLELRVSLNGELTDSDLSEALVEAGYSTLKEVLAAFEMVLGKPKGSSVSELLELQLHYTEDGGETWIEADAEHFPKDEALPVSLPVPEGTNPKTHTYHVTVMYTEDMNGHKAGEIRQIGATPRLDEDGSWILDVQVDGLVLMLVRARAIAAALPETGDSSSLALWMAVMGISLLAMGCLRRRRAL